MPMTKYGKYVMTPFIPAKNMPIRIKSGEEYREQFPLNRMYDMTMYRDYTITANRAVPGVQRYDSDGNLGRGDAALPKLISNKLSIQIGGR
jgi:hypothetical protein